MNMSNVNWSGLTTGHCCVKTF